MRTTPRRVLRCVVGIPATLWLLYVVVANAFFLFGGLGWVVNSTKDVHLTYGFAWSFWPGTFHAKSVRVLGQDHNVQWALEVDETEVTVELSALLAKRFHATRVRGDGASFRFRHRVSPDRVDDPLTELLPPIAGHAPPLLQPPPPPRDPNQLWTVHFEDVDVSVRELWFQQFRYLGSGRARGAFRLRPALHLWVGPASLDLGPGPIGVGGVRVIDAISGRVDCVVHPFDVRVPIGRQVFRFVTTSIRLDGHGVTLDPLEPFLPPGARLTSQGGTLGVAVEAERGVFTPHSRVALGMDRVELERARWRALGEHLLVEMRSRPDGQGQLELSVKAGSFGERGAPAPALEIGSSSAAIKSSSTDSSLDWQIAGVELESDRLRAPDLRRMNRTLAGSGFAFSGGAATGSVRVRSADDIVNGSATIHVSHARARRAGVELSFDGRSAVDFSNVDRKRGAGNVAFTLDGNRVVVSRGTSTLRGSNARLVAHGEIVEGRGSGEIRLRVEELAAKLGPTKLTSRARLDLRVQSRDGTGELSELAASGTLEDVRAVVGSRLRAHIESATLRTRLSATPATAGESHLPHGFLDLVARGVTAMDAGDLRKLRHASVERVALQSVVGPGLDGRRRLAVNATLDNAHMRWDDVRASASPRFTADIDERVILGRVGPAFVDLHLDAEKLVAKIGEVDLSSRARMDLRVQTRGATRELSELAAAGELEDVRVAVGSMRAHADSVTLGTRISMPAENREDQRPDGSMDVLARGVSLVEVSDFGACRWAAADVLSVHGELGLDADGRRRLALSSRFDNGRARWHDLRASASARLGVDIDARLLDGEVGPVRVSVDATNVALQSGAGRRTGWQAAIPKLDVDAVLEGKPHDLSGRLWVGIERVDGRLGDTPVHASVLVNGSVSAFDPTKGEAIGSVDLAIDRAGLTGKRVVVKDWWARARISSARITVSKNLDIWGQFRGKLRDGQPLLALFSDGGSIPGWLPGALPLADLEVKGVIHRACQLTDLDLEAMSGGPLTGKARIQSVPDGVRAAMVLRLTSTPLSVGLAVSEGKTYVSAFAGDGWLAEQYVTLDQLGGKILLGRCTKLPNKCEF